MKVGRSVTLRVNDHFFQSRMIDIKDKYIYLDMPINLETRKTSFLQTNTPIEVEYIGDDRARYHFSSKVVDRQLTNIPKLIIAIPKQVERIQRREFVRVQTAVDVALHSPTKAFSAFTTVTNDISGGGLSIVVPSYIKLPIAELVDVYLVLHINPTKIHYLSLSAKVLRVTQTKDLPTSASLQFKNISVKDQQKIVQFCLAKQREMRRKELQ